MTRALHLRPGKMAEHAITASDACATSLRFEAMPAYSNLHAVADHWSNGKIRINLLLVQFGLANGNRMPCAIIRTFLLLTTFVLLLIAGSVCATSKTGCQKPATENCYFVFQPAPKAGDLHYYASQSPVEPAGTDAPDTALIVVHGHARDANIIFNAALSAAEAAGTADRTVVVAPIFQVDSDQAGRCSTPGVPAARSGDLLWTCASWMDGGEAENTPGMTSFAAMDALVSEITRRWPTIRAITIAGFSAGAQMVQHYIGFATSSGSSKVTVHYVVADPGTWLYFDSVRPAFHMDGHTADVSSCTDTSCRFRLSKLKATAACPEVNRWKYGTDGLPPALDRRPAEARAQYASADIHYLEAAQDSGTGKGAYSRILDKTCAAEAQGTFRLQRGLAYAAYDRQVLAPDQHRRVVIVPDCAHDVTCVLTSLAARAVLLGPSH